ncbi:MAG: prepilin peptidase [Armatimonadota bacterium]
MLPIYIGAPIAFIYGIIVGSFLNVCIYRMPEDKSVINPPSHCPICNTRLRGLDLVPLFSFLFLGKKCRYCKTPISWRYFLIELLTGVFFTLVYFKHGYSIDFFAYVLFGSALIIAFFVDLEHLIIPDQVWQVGAVVGLGKDIAHIIAGSGGYVQIPIPFTEISFPMLNSIIGFLICGGIFYIIGYVSFYIFMPKDEKSQEEYEGGMGAGDVKLAAGTGAVLGVLPAIVSFFIAIVLGAFIGVGILIARSRQKSKDVEWRTQIPFGPFMVVGAMAWMFADKQLIWLWSAWVNFVAP